MQASHPGGSARPRCHRSGFGAGIAVVPPSVLLAVFTIASPPLFHAGQLATSRLASSTVFQTSRISGSSRLILIFTLIESLSPREEQARLGKSGFAFKV
jgi:hypothetical protein